MKIVILAGGLGTRLAEETTFRPKPMVEIGSRPILWHIMKIYEAAGFREFVIALGYKSELIKQFFFDYHVNRNDVTIETESGNVTVHQQRAESFKVHLVDTGVNSQTGSRVKRLQPWLDGETFMLTYGDGLADVNVSRLAAFHGEHGKLATVTAVRPPARFGALRLSDGAVREFVEKPNIGEGWINGGFFVFEPGVFDYIDSGDDVILEHTTLERLATDQELAAYQHDGYWQCMDSMRDVNVLNSLWESGAAPWKMWD
jgi:glucose-1-phosphate cytidylyltransferase